MDQELSATLDDERVIVGGYLNGHIGRSRDGIERIHGGWGTGADPGFKKRGGPIYLMYG